MNWIYITAAPEIAAYAEGCGVQQVMIDLESIGKEERQGHLDTHRSMHSVEAIPAVASALREAELMVRVNPLGSHSVREIDAVILAGAERLMLPMFRTADEVVRFRQLVGGRVPITLLVETPAALVHIVDFLPLLGARDRLHFGLNDLTIAMGYAFVFEPLAHGDLDAAAGACRDAGAEFGIGGVGRAGQGKVTPELILGEHVRLGSNWAILSRAFRGAAPNLASLQAEMDMRAELDLLARAEALHRSNDGESLLRNQTAFRAAVGREAQARASV